MRTLHSFGSRLRTLALAERLPTGAAFGADATAGIDAPRLALSLSLTQIAAALLFIPVLAFALSALWLAVGGRLAPAASGALLVLSLLGALAGAHALFGKDWRISAIATVAFGVLALLLASLSFDTSIDGQHYHFQAIYALAQGWNPVWDAGPPPVIADPATPWVFHYPRAAWLVAANLFAVGVGLPAVKALNFVLLFSAALLVAATLLRAGVAWLPTVLLTAAAALNPIVVSQLLTGMNDGVFALCILIFGISLASQIAFGERGAFAVLLAALIFGLNLKFSAVPIFAMLSAVAVAAIFAFRGFEAAARSAAAVFAAAVFAIVVLGWSPYVTNYLYFGHIFHPVMGPNALDIMRTNTPDVLNGMSGPQRFLFSLFSETHAGYGPTLAELKIPFMVRADEIRMAGGVDVRIGGFGPLFSGILLLALIATVLLLAGSAARNRTVAGLLFVAAGLLASVLVMPENWWARYVPQFWYVPWCVALAAIIGLSRPARALGAAIVLLMLADAAIVTSTSLWLAAKRSRAVSAQIAALQQTREPYCVAPDLAQSRLYLLRHAGVEARAITAKQPGCASPEPIAAYGPDREGGTICKCAN